jgi:hypothetical protein
MGFRSVNPIEVVAGRVTVTMAVTVSGIWEQARGRSNWAA